MTSWKIAEAIYDECCWATTQFPPFASAHEGYAILLEEMDELKTEIWKHQSKRDMARMRKEAIQVGAMALRFVFDVCEAQSG